MAIQNGKINGELKESLIVGCTNQGSELRGTLLRITRHSAAFEIYNSPVVLRKSEILQDFRIIIREQMVYMGQALIHNIVNTGLVLVCEVSLAENDWKDVGFSPQMLKDGALQTTFSDFLHEWQRSYKVLPEFKVVVADIHSFLSELRMWLEQIEIGIRSSPSESRDELENELVQQIAGQFTRNMDSFVERFESITARMESELHPAHQAYFRRQLHSLIVSSPFAYRTYYKPLGYAGDYEMVNMMLRSPYEGGSLFAKAINVWLLSQQPVVAHRNRIDYLLEMLIRESCRLKRVGRVVRVFNLGCGPAVEIQRLFREYAAVGALDLTLVDFNEETLKHVEQTLTITGRRSSPSSVRLVKKSVHSILKEGMGRANAGAAQYDIVYCAGLFDYLSDQICSRLMHSFYDMLAPGGLLIATNVSEALNSSRPFRHSMEYILDWHLAYRAQDEMANLVPHLARNDNANIKAESSGVNLIVEVRKPQHD